MKVSVVVPCYNARAFIAETLASVAAQTHPDVEVIVVDDGSTDGSADLVAALAPGVRLERLRHGGAPRARNHGLALSTGDAVAFLDADDLLAPETLAASVATLEGSPPRTVAVAGWHYLELRRGAWCAVGHELPAAPDGDPLAGWLVGRFHPTSTLLWPASFVRELGGWDESITKNQDGDLAMRALLRGARLAFNARGGSVAYRRHGPGSRSVSAGKSRADVDSCIRVVDRIAHQLRATGRFEAYRIPLARSYFELARQHCLAQPVLSWQAHERARELGGARFVASTLLRGIGRRVRAGAVSWARSLVRYGFRRRAPAPFARTDSDSPGRE